MVFFSLSFFLNWTIVAMPNPVFLPGESPWTEKPGGLQSIGSQRIRHNWATKHTGKQCLNMDYYVRKYFLEKFWYFSVCFIANFFLHNFPHILHYLMIAIFLKSSRGHQTNTSLIELYVFPSKLWINLIIFNWFQNPREVVDCISVNILLLYSTIIFIFILFFIFLI